MLLEEIADYLSTGGIGTVATNIFCGRMPDQPDACVTVYETGGTAPVRAMGPTVVEEVAGLQVVCRDADRTAARLKANDVLRRLDGIGDVTLGATRYLWITAQQAPFQMGYDEAQNRALIACNYLVYKARSTA